MSSTRKPATFQMDDAALLLLELERQRRLRLGIARSLATLSQLVNEAVVLAFGTKEQFNGAIPGSEAHRTAQSIVAKGLNLIPAAKRRTR